METQAENRLLAGLNYLQYSKLGGGILNHADPLTTYNSVKDNTNMSSVIGANMGGFFINGAAKMADGMANICLDPYGAIEGLINMAANPQETFEAVSKGIETFSFHMVGADSQEKARLEGKLLFDIASIVLLAKTGKAAEGTKGAQGANEAGGLAKRGVSINKTEAEMANASRSAGGPGVAEGSGTGVKSGLKTTEVTPPGSSHPVKVYTDGNAQINTGKIDTYMRGKVELDVNTVKSRINELKNIKKTNPENFNKNMKSELKSCEDKLHNYQRSQEMSKTLNNAGILDNAENNQMIAEELLEAAKSAKSGNTEIISYIEGSNGKIQVVSRWKILDDCTPYLATVILKPIK